MKHITATATAWAWDADVPPTQKLLLLALAGHINGEGEAWPSLRRLGDMTGVSRATVIRALESLVAAGYLERRARFTPRGQTSNCYLLCVERDPATLPRVLAADDPPVSECDPPRSHSDTPPSQNDTPPVSRVTPPPSQSETPGTSTRRTVPSEQVPPPTPPTGGGRRDAQIAERLLWWEDWRTTRQRHTGIPERQNPNVRELHALEGLRDTYTRDQWQTACETFWGTSHRPGDGLLMLVACIAEVLTHAKQRPGRRWRDPELRSFTAQADEADRALAARWAAGGPS